MNRPTAAQLFALYHLGVDAEGVCRFRNLHQCARELRTDADTLLGWLREARIDQDTATRVKFNVSAAHVDAQLAASPEQALQIAADHYAAFVAARDQGGTDQVHLDIDYDALPDADAPSA